MHALYNQIRMNVQLTAPLAEPQTHSPSVASCCEQALLLYLQAAISHNLFLIVTTRYNSHVDKKNVLSESALGLEMGEEKAAV